ncbi:SDR family NAD(P)-dependent oxidoreductase [Mesobacterium pallidum]|uniref:SDR family NAD(P)-dependent oxidoreductase n=1 Tax=Mesobacterium pallidum TaxID=2872037 RepID=UPI001EE2F649|nr:SDR family oxidoreductase [Mesobacterium pallidum]
MTRILIAGGATGIGAAVALAALETGGTALVADVNAEGLEQLASHAAHLPGQLDTLLVDLATPEAPARVAEAAAAAMGGVDCLFVNAGLMLAARLEDWTPEMWDRSDAINLRLPMFLTQAVLPLLRASDNASVVYTSSTGALRGHAGMPAYHATKSGILGLVRALADELGPEGIRVNALLPGWIDTPFNNGFWDHQDDAAATRAKIEAGIPMRRHGAANEVAGTVLYLASPAARYVTGTQLVVDGGYTAV